MIFKLILRINGDFLFNCAVDKDCYVYYNRYQTPSIISLIPQNFYAGSEIQFRFRPKSTTVNLLSNIKIGKNTCAPTFNRYFVYQSNADAYFNCFIGDVKPDKIQDFLLNHFIGLPSVLSSFYKGYLNPEIFYFTENFNTKTNQNDLKNFSNDDNIKKLFVNIDALNFFNADSDKNPFAFNSFPFISNILTNEISPEGKNIIKIKGQGFFANKDLTMVFIDTQVNPCIITQLTTEEIICETTKLNQNLLEKVAKYTNFNNNTDYVKPEYEKLNYVVFPGTQGLSYKLYSTINNNDEYFTKINKNFTISDIFLETSSKYNQNDYFSEYFTGYFKAPITSEYKFYVASDDFAFVFLWINKERKKIIDWRSWSESADFISNPAQYSKWIPLIGGNVYYIEIIHHEMGGIDHITLGVEIKNPKYLRINKRNLFEKRELELYQRIKKKIKCNLLASY